MQQTVLAREQRDERTEGCDLDDRAKVALADFRHVRIRDRIDRGTCGFGGRTVGCADEDRAVVLDRDLGSGVFLDLVDHLALRADDLTDLVDWDLDGDDARCVLRHLLRLGDRFVHLVENDETGVTGLGECACKHRCRDTVELRVELQCGDEVTRTGNLEVHVTESVLGTEDVGQRDVLRLAIDLVGHETHRDTRDRCLEWNACVEQRHRGCTDRTH